MYPSSFRFARRVRILFNFGSCRLSAESWLRTRKAYRYEPFPRSIFTINAGDRIGVVGNNGAGKTTLLRVLAGAYPPTSGTLERVGRISALTDISLGMDPEATGLENILFRLVFMGLTFAEARKLSPEIEEFSELGEHLKMPVHTYSSGMYLRLAFSISTAVNSEIIVMDEMISAGDAHFIAKAQRRLSELLQRVSIIVVATHDAAHAGLLQSACMAGPRRNTKESAVSTKFIRAMWPLARMIQSPALIGAPTGLSI